MTVSREEIEHIARLAALEVDDAAVAELTRQIGDILHYVSQLEGVDPDAGTNAGETVPGSSPSSPLRDDVADPIPMTHPPDEMAPEFADGFYLIPKVAGLGEDE